MAALVTSLLLAGCGDREEVGMSSTVSYVDDDGVAYSLEDYYVSPGGVAYARHPTTLVVVDAARNGVVDLDDPLDVDFRYEPEPGFGALFLANLDDDGQRCQGLNSDAARAACSDAEVDEVQNDDDLADMARIRTAPVTAIPSSTYGILHVDENSRDRVRLYRNVDGGHGADSFELYEMGVEQIDAQALEDGVEFAIEGLALIEDRQVWDGTVELTWEIHIPDRDEVFTDRARMELAPILLRHHLDAARIVYASNLGQQNRDFRTDLGAAVDAAEVSDGLHLITTWDPWTQDYFENGYMAMPGPDGLQVIQVYFRSPNISYPGSLEALYQRWYQRAGQSMPAQLREAGADVYDDLHGPGTAVVTFFDPDKGFDPVDLDGVNIDDAINYITGSQSNQTYPDILRLIDQVEDADTLDSFGNTETIPPHVAPDGTVYPHGRIIRGRGDRQDFRPDTRLSALFDAQGLQDTVWVDTEWLVVAHVDEGLSFVESNTERGWSVLYSAPTRAREMLEELQSNGHGEAILFEGLTYPGWGWGQSSTPAERTVNQILDDTDIMAASALAAVRLNGQMEVLREEVGIGDEDFVPIPHLFEDLGYGLVAYQPGMTNGISLRPDFFGPPRPHGPWIEGEDVFKTEVEATLGAIGVEVFWIENWYVYHVGLGEVHCASNVERELPQTPWWMEERQ